MREGTIGTLKLGEPHPSAFSAHAYLLGIGLVKLIEWQDYFNTAAAKGDRTSEICKETLARLLSNLPVSDRYLLGLAWHIATNDPGKNITLAEESSSS